MRASAVFSQAIPFPPRLFAEREEDGEGKVKSRPFLSSAPALLPGQRQSGSEPPTKWEMIRILLLSIQTLMLLERNKLLIGYYSERQKKVVMVKEPALSRKSPHPPLCQRGARGDFGLSVRSIPKDSRRHVHLFRSFTIDRPNRLEYILTERGITITRLLQGWRSRWPLSCREI